MTIKVVHAIASDLFAGVEAHVRALACAQADAGLKVSVLGGKPERMRPELERHDVHFSPAATTGGLTRALPTAIRNRPEILHAHMTGAEFASVCATALRPGATSPRLVTTRHFAAPRGNSTFRRALLGPVMNRRIAAQIAASKYIADHIDGPSTVVHAGVPFHELVPAEQRGRSVIVVSRLQPEKHVDLALAAFAASRLRDLGWRLQIVGGGSEKPALRARADALQILTDTTFHGHVSDVNSLMSDAAILFAPNPVEPFGLAVLEAMASGLPVVAAGSGGHLETVGIVDDAALFDPGDVERAASLLRLLALDASRRDAYGRLLHQAQRTRFTLERQAIETEAVYRSVL